MFMVLSPMIKVLWLMKRKAPIDYSRKCEAPGCEVSGKAKYRIINEIRYCSKHALRMLRYNRLDTQDS